MSLSNPLPVHLRVGPAGTHLPGWIHAIGPDGSVYHPLGRDPSGGPGVAFIDNRTWFAIDGTCEINLPAGRNSLFFSRIPGWQFEYFEIEVSQGQLAARIIPCAPLPNLPDTLEIDLGCTGLSPGTAWFEGRASGLDGVQLFHNPLAPQDCPSMLEFSGRETAIEREGCAVQVNTRNFGNVLGTLSLLDCHRPVYPLTFSEANFSSWSLSDWWDQCHRKRGLVIWADEPMRNDPDNQGEALAGILLGKVDALECMDFEGTRGGGINLWMDLLTVGMAPALAGCSGLRCSETFPGKMRSLIHHQDAHWVTSVARSQVTATVGPSLAVRVNGSLPGQPIRLENECLDLDANPDPYGCTGTPRTFAVELLGDQGLLWRSTAKSGDRIRAEIPLPQDTGPQITIRLTDPHGRILAQTSPFTVHGRRTRKTDHSMAAMNRLSARLEATARQISGNPIHGDRREQVTANLEAAKLKLISAIS